jgi:diacylglycerol kinase family enzyme
MQTAVLIANPSASQFTGGVFRQITATLSKEYDLTTEWPISAHETEVAARRAAASNVGVVFAMGGDGVAHHAANALVYTNTALGIIPVGTTNVLSRILGIAQKANRAASDAVAYEPIPTRMIRVDAVTPLGDLTRHATFSLGVGFDADVVETAETRPFSKTRFGSVHYATTAVSRLLSSWRSEHPNLRMTCDRDRFDALAALTQVHDPYTYFGRFPLRLTPDPPEGIATLAANDLGITRAVEILSRAAVGLGHRESTGVRLWTDYQRLEIDAEPRTPFQADGELLGYASHITVTPAEDSLLVLRPQPA